MRQHQSSDATHYTRLECLQDQTIDKRLLTSNQNIEYLKPTKNVRLWFQVRDGESLLVMGPSGVGKTSVLRAIAGLWSTGSGTITRSVTKLSTSTLLTGPYAMYSQG